MTSKKCLPIKIEKHLIGFINIWSIVAVKTLDNNNYHIKFAMIEEYTKVSTYKKCIRT
jgi:hypothetical protein